MKKLLLLALCIVFVLCGCDKKAEPFYETTSDKITLTTDFHYYFSDDTFLLTHWSNQTEGTIRFTDEFRLEKLSGNTWYTVSEKEAPLFNKDYLHILEPMSEGMARYDIDAYLDALEQQTTYRLSTYCFDESGNYYQVYAEFVCDDEAANIEIEGLMDVQELPSES